MVIASASDLQGLHRWAGSPGLLQRRRRKRFMHVRAAPRREQPECRLRARRVVAARYHRGALSDAVGEGWTGADAPLRLAATPAGDALVLAMGNGGLLRLDVDRLPSAPPRLVPALGEPWRQACQLRPQSCPVGVLPGPGGWTALCLAAAEGVAKCHSGNISPGPVTGCAEQAARRARAQPGCEVGLGLPRARQAMLRRGWRGWAWSSASPSARAVSCWPSAARTDRSRCSPGRR